VIVGLLHQSAGHLGIFVSGAVAKKEHAQIVSVLKSIEALPPGLYGMAIKDVAGKGGKPAYEVEFQEHRLEEIVERLNRFKRKDEAAFEAVERVSDFNQKAYELLARPLVQTTSNEASAKVMRELHPLRAERWSISDANPWLAWVGPVAEAVRDQRAALDGDTVPRQTEEAMSELISATLDCYRAVRDSTSEAMFFQTFGSMFALTMADEQRPSSVDAAARAAEGQELVRKALASIEQGGYAAAVVRIGTLLARHGEPLPLERLALRKELIADYAGLLPELEPAAWRRLRGEQEIIVRYAPEQALATLPKLLVSRDDRTRLLRLVEGLMNDPRVEGFKPTAEQRAMVELLRAGLQRSTVSRSTAGRASTRQQTRKARAAQR
jgi:hypothetical protein